MTSAPGHRTHDLHRFVTFVDACIAIAVTLLVLPLVEAAGDVEKGVPLSDFLSDHQSLFWSFLLSFAVICQIWLGHHSYLSLVEHADRRLFSWVLAWTLCVVLIPVPTALISSYDSDSGIVPLYIGLLFVSSVCSTGLALHVGRHPELWREGVTDADVSAIDSVVMSAIYLAALLLGTFVESVNYYALLLLILAGPVTTYFRARRFGALTTHPARKS